VIFTNVTASAASTNSYDYHEVASSVAIAMASSLAALALTGAYSWLAAGSRDVFSGYYDRDASLPSASAPLSMTARK
jgi:hypothetical protein